ncbi:hypothetical protein QG37_02380 [Candidozyma auris]|nr:hypothetical protein QG37_02380 [[Candida] auris]
MLAIFRSHLCSDMAGPIRPEKKKKNQPHKKATHSMHFMTRWGELKESKCCGG